MAKKAETQIEDQPPPPPAPVARVTRGDVAAAAAQARDAVSVEAELDAILAPDGPLMQAARAGLREVQITLPDDPIKPGKIRSYLTESGFRVEGNTVSLPG